MKRRWIESARKRLRLLVCFSAICAAVQPLFAHADVADDLPMVGDASSRLISPQMERELGENFLKQVHAALPTVEDPILKHYVQRQLAGLIQYSELREPILATVLIDSDEINAFAAPGGIVGINLGLMLHARDVHEYSSVVAHELAHLSQRHFARGIEEQRAQTLPMLAGMLAAIMIGAMGGGDAGLAAISGVQAASQAGQLRYSRGREQEADRIGLNTLARAGLDPQGMSRMFDRMDRAYRFTRRPPEFLLTHPLTETRIADAKTQAMEYPREQYPSSLEYQVMRARARVRYAQSPQVAVKTFEQEVEEQPDNPGARYGLAVALAGVERFDEAIALVDQIYTDNPHNILFSASMADLLTESGKIGTVRRGHRAGRSNLHRQPAQHSVQRQHGGFAHRIRQDHQAIGLLERELAVNPQNATLSVLYADALVANKQYVAAEAVLQQQSFVNKADVNVWYDLAEVSGLAGNIIGVHLARAEFFELHGAYQRTIQHLQYARRLAGRRDAPLTARLDQRINDIRNKMREERS